MHNEEHHLYQLVDAVITGQDMSVTETMAIDHQFMERQIGWIDESLRAASLNAQDSKHGAIRQELKLLLAQLDAVLRLHLRREEQVYLTVLRHYASHEIGSEIQLRMRRVYGEGKANTVPTAATLSSER